MSRPLLLAALIAATPWAMAQSTPAKKELAQRLVNAQSAGLEGLARGLVEQPAAQLMQAAGQALQSQVAPERREAVGKEKQREMLC